MPLLGAFAIAVVGLGWGWAYYSVVQQRMVEDNIFPPLAILASYQVVASFGDLAASNHSEMIMRTTSTNPMEDFSWDDPHAWMQVGGGEDTLRKSTDSTSNLQSRRYQKGSIIHVYSPDENHSALFCRPSGRGQFKLLTLRELASSCTKTISVEEDVTSIANWNSRIQDCHYLPVGSNETGKRMQRILQGDNTFIYCYRDYANFEEVHGMLNRRGCTTLLKYWSTGADALFLHPNGDCIKTSGGIIYGIFPLTINWMGKIEGDLIMWERTMMRLGWKGIFGRTIDRPPMAEKFRAKPWQILLPNEDDNNDVLCLRREAKGHLIFAQERLLKKRWIDRVNEFFGRRNENHPVISGAYEHS